MCENQWCQRENDKRRSCHNHETPTGQWPLVIRVRQTPAGPDTDYRCRRQPEPWAAEYVDDLMQSDQTAKGENSEKEDAQGYQSPSRAERRDIYLHKGRIQ